MRSNLDVVELRGTTAQQQIARQAIEGCTFPLHLMLPSLQKINMSKVVVEWADLSRYGERTFRAHDDEHSHITDPDTGAVAHPIERIIDGRRRVLGLFYLPPYTKVVLDNSLVNSPPLGREVTLAEFGHGVDYHWMTPQMRWEIVNLLHEENLPPGHPVHDGAIFKFKAHTCSWFDHGPYAMWVGEAFMEMFCEAFSNERVTIVLGHPTEPWMLPTVKKILLPPEPEPEPVPEPKVEYCGFRRSKVFHRLECWVARLMPLRCGMTFSSVSDAVAAGRRGCRICKPPASDAERARRITGTPTEPNASTPSHDKGGTRR